MKKLENNKVAKIELIRKEHDTRRKFEFRISWKESNCKDNFLFHLLNVKIEVLNYKWTKPLFVRKRGIVKYFLRKKIKYRFLEKEKIVDATIFFKRSKKKKDNHKV
jgi:hypothetical protein